MGRWEVEENLVVLQGRDSFKASALNLLCLTFFLSFFLSFFLFLALETFGFEPKTFPLKEGHSTSRVLLPSLPFPFLSFTFLF